MYLWSRSMSFVLSSNSSMGLKPVSMLVRILSPRVLPESAMISSILLLVGGWISFGLGVNFFGLFHCIWLDWQNLL
jgi:hypothetical protein